MARSSSRDSATPRCARCAGPTHTLAVESALALRRFPSAGDARLQSHWCVACMQEAWPASVVGERYALVWKAVRAEPPSESAYHWQELGGFSAMSAAEGGLMKTGLTRDGSWYRGVLGAPYRIGFPSALLGSANFLLSPLGALKEQRGRARRLLPPDPASAIAAVVVPWRSIALDRRQVLVAAAHTPQLPVAARAVDELVDEGLSAERATELLNGLPDSWSGVEHWESRLRPTLPEDWPERMRAAEYLAAGLALLGRLPSHDRPDHVAADLQAERQRRELDEAAADGETVAERSIRFSRFLGVLAEELMGDPDREARYNRARRVYRDLLDSGGTTIASRWLGVPAAARLMGPADPTRTALDLSAYEGVERWHWIHPWLELECLMDCLRDEEMEVWTQALAKAAAVADLDAT